MLIHGIRKTFTALDLLMHIAENVAELLPLYLRCQNIEGLN